MNKTNRIVALSSFAQLLMIGWFKLNLKNTICMTLRNYLSYDPKVLMFILPNGGTKWLNRYATISCVTVKLIQFEIVVIVESIPKNVFPLILFMMHQHCKRVERGVSITWFSTSFFGNWVINCLVLWVCSFENCTKWQKEVIYKHV